jgi:hypothetical protein
MAAILEAICGVPPVSTLPITSSTLKEASSSQPPRFSASSWPMSQLFFSNCPGSFSRLVTASQLGQLATSFAIVAIVILISGPLLSSC